MGHPLIDRLTGELGWPCLIMEDEVALKGLSPDWITEEGGLRLRPDYWPEQGGMDGFYIACLKKPG